MSRETFELTKGEVAIMELLWDSQRPLTSMDICQMTDLFGESYIHRSLRSLQKKGLIEIDGFMKSGKKYARKFVPLITKEEYGAQVIKQLGINDEKALAKMAVAMVNHFCDTKENNKQELIKQLENIVEELKNS